MFRLLCHLANEHYSKETSFFLLKINILTQNKHPQISKTVYDIILMKNLHIFQCFFEHFQNYSKIMTVRL